MAEKIPENATTRVTRDTTLLKTFVTFEVSDLDDADTVTVPNMTTVDNVKVINLVDASDITVNTATNVITVNDVLAVNSHVLIVAVGN